MEKVVPWSGLEALVRPHYAKAGKGRQPVGLSIMLQTYFVQQWFNLSDPGVEEALYESAALRRFVGADLGVAPAPDETTASRFRHLLERHDLGGLVLDAAGDLTKNWAVQSLIRAEGVRGEFELAYNPYFGNFIFSVHPKLSPDLQTSRKTVPKA
jgi:hypothetical protein